MKNRTLAAFVCLVCAAGTCVRAASGGDYQQWGRDTLAMIRTDYRLSSGLYAQSLSGRFSAYAWGQGIMFSALTAASKVDPSYVAETRAVADRFRSSYWCTRNGTSGYNAGAGGCGDRYYDDNAWIALALIELYEACGDEKYLTWAKETVAFSMSGENGPGDNPPGGIRWHESRTGGSSVCAGAPTSLANLMLYELTGIEQYFEDGLRVYTWLATCGLHRLSNGIYHEVNEGPLGYQTAVVTQCAVRLHRITGAPAYLAEAQKLGAAMEHEFINKDSHRLNQTGKWGGHDMTNAYTDLYKADGNPHWLNIAAGYIEFLRANGWDTATGRYPTSWNNTTHTPGTELIDQASVARAYWAMASTPGGSAPVYVNVVNRSSNRCLRTYNSAKADNTGVVLFDVLAGYTSEMWTLTDLQNGYYGIRSWHSDSSLQLQNNQTANNTPVVIYSTNAANGAQQWTLSAAGGDWYNIQNRLSGKSLQPYNGFVNNNTNIVVTTTNISASTQQWKFPDVAVPTSITPSVSVNGGPWTQTDRVVYHFGDAITFRGQAAGSGNWSWSGPGGFTASGSECTLSNANPAQGGTYSVKFTNSSGVESYSGITIVPVTGVTLFEHHNYTGWAARFGPGAYRSADLTAIGAKSNDATSVRVKPGYKVTFYDYDNFGGPVLVKTADDASLVDDGWNDRVGSMIIEEIDGPIAHWPMNEGSGILLGDVSSYGFDGDFVNMQADAWTQGKHCRGLSFDGVDDYVTITGFRGVSGSQSRTCSAWVRTTGVSVDIVGWGVSAMGRKWRIRVNESGSLRAEVQGGYIYGATPINDGQWHHVAVVLENDGTPDISEAVLYVDGVRDTVQGVIPCPIDTSGTRDVSFGYYAKCLHGQLDEVRIYARALDDAEVWGVYEMHALAADIDANRRVDLADFAALSDAWQISAADPGDLSCDNVVDAEDLTILIEEWLDVL